jgi:hypothetical protein
VTDVQLITLVISIVVAVVFPVSMLIYSNSRITDVKDTLRAEMALGFERVSLQITRLEASLKLHEIEHHK